VVVTQMKTQCIILNSYLVRWRNIDAEVRREGLSMLVSGLITLSNGSNNTHQLLCVIQGCILS
jgi:hypothetical protein